MFCVSNEELKNAPMLGSTCTCWICGEEHEVKEGDPPGILKFFKCSKNGRISLLFE